MTDVADEFGLGPLDLSDAESMDFEALPTGRYNAEIFKITRDSVKNADGKGALPAGTPMLKVQFKITDDPYVNRRVFKNYMIPPTDPDVYDQDKAKKLRGMLADFFVAAGEAEEKVKGAGFQPDFEDYIGRAVVVVLGRREYPKDSGIFQNDVNGVKPAGSDTGGNSTDGGLL